MNIKSLVVAEPPYRKVAVLVGILFITSTITFSIGSGLIQGFFAEPGGAVSQLIIGVLLEIYTGLAVAGIGFLMLPILRRYSKKLAVGYVLLRVLECLVIAGIGVYFLATQKSVQNYDLLIYTFTGLGGILLAYLLYISRLVPRALAVLGMVGYIVLLIGIPSDLFGYTNLDSDSGLIFFAPGGLFELVLPLWLFVKGFAVSRNGRVVVK